MINNTRYKNLVWNVKSQPVSINLSQNIFA